MFEDSAGRFWLGDDLDGLYQVDRATGAVTRTLPGRSIFEDRGGNLWFGDPPGLTRLDRAGNLQKIRLDVPASSEPTIVRSFYEDDHGILWLGTSSGLVQFDPSSETSKAYSTADGMAAKNVICVLPGSDGNLWMSGGRYLMRFDPRRKQFWNYEERDGTQGGASFYRNGCHRAGDGKLYFAGGGGVTAFDPRSFPVNSPEPFLALTSFEVKDKPSPSPGDEVRLQSAQNSFSFEFAALDLARPWKYRYRFRLEPLELDWVAADNERRFARYTDIAPGRYVFRVEDSEDGRNWNHTAASLRLTILPPWWRTWWAEALAALLLAVSATAAYALRMGSLRRNETRLKALVESRTAELAKAKDKAQEARDQAEAANRAKSVFLSHMSHELRNPLSSILSVSGLLREAGLSKEHGEYVGMINRSGEHLLTLINDVLDLAKVEAGKEQMVLAPVDVGALARAIVEMLQVKAESKGLLLVCTHSPDLPPCVRADATKVRQVVINLLGNAVKFTDTGVVTLRLSATPLDDNGRVRLRFEVEDTGVGIAPQDQARIFEPFVQVSYAAGQKGTGLGLAIARQFAELMGGSLAVESTLGHGSRFTLEVPAEVVSRDDLQPEAGSFSARWLALEANQPECRVLIVEDDPENALVLEQMLSRAGFLVRVAGTGPAGIATFRQWSPRFIWMDMQLPGMSGIEAMRRIRELPGGREVKIAIITASAFGSEREDVWSAGADDFVRKPYRPGEIFDCLARHLGIRFRVDATVPEPSASPRSLSGLSADLRAELRSAVIALDPDRIRSVIDSVAQPDPELAVFLRRFADRLSYTAILNMLDKVEVEARSGADARPNPPSRTSEPCPDYS